jgi:epsilon-lactone hydrolase
MRLIPVLCAFIAAGAAVAAQNGAPANAPQTDTSHIDADGTARITRVVPVPKTVSPEAQATLARHVSDAAVPETLDERRHKTDVWQNHAGETARALYPVKSIEEQSIAGVKCRIIQPNHIGAGKEDRVLINLHGGGFNSDSGSLTETIPIAALTQTKVVAVLYPLAPEHPFPAAVDASVDVYKELLKTYKPGNMVIYGTSAGAVLTAEVAVKLKQLGLPLPAALGIFSGFGDFTEPGDSQSLFSLNGLSGHLDPPKRPWTHGEYTGTADQRDPVLSPIFADLKGMPPALFVSSTRDLLLSGTCLLHRAFLRAGVDARLAVFEALPHAFWNDVRLPESKEMHALSAQFFDEILAGKQSAKAEKY